MIRNALVERLKRRSKGDLKSQHYEAALTLSASHMSIPFRTGQLSCEGLDPRPCLSQKPETNPKRAPDLSHADVALGHNHMLRNGSLPSGLSEGKVGP